MKKYLIRFNSHKVDAVMPVSPGSEIFCVSQFVVTTLENAKVMFEAMQIETTVLDEFKPEITEE